MQKGYNSDLVIQGKNYHVQTEDWGLENPYLVSRIFHNGAVVKTVKVSHHEILQKAPIGQKDGLKWALQKLHSQVIEDLAHPTSVEK